jgi:hypothetical protein
VSCRCRRAAATLAAAVGPDQRRPAWLRQGGGGGVDRRRLARGKAGESCAAPRPAPAPRQQRPHPSSDSPSPLFARSRRAFQLSYVSLGLTKALDLPCCCSLASIARSRAEQLAGRSGRAREAGVGASQPAEARLHIQATPGTRGITCRVRSVCRGSTRSCCTQAGRPSSLEACLPSTSRGPSLISESAPMPASQAELCGCFPHL